MPVTLLDLTQADQKILIDLLNNLFFLTGALCLSAGRGVLRLTRLPRHDRGPVPGGNRSTSCHMHGPETGIIPLLDEIA